jgi:hypothetical protein
MNDCQHKVPTPGGGWFCGKPGPCYHPHCEPKREVINVDNPEAFKESIMNSIQWTEASMKDEFHRWLDACDVNEDAGVRLKLPINTFRTPKGLVAWMELPISFMAEMDYFPRLDAAARNLSKLFHVEHTKREGDRDEITIHRITVRYEYDRPV